MYIQLVNYEILFIYMIMVFFSSTLSTYPLEVKCAFFNIMIEYTNKKMLSWVT